MRMNRKFWQLNLTRLDSMVHDDMAKPLSEQGLTIVHPFYNEDKRFEIQFKNWQNLSDRVKECVNIVVVDDASDPSIKSFITPSKNKRIDFNLTIYRILKDLKHNTPGALNLGIQQAPTRWVLIMDSDCLMEPDALEKLIDLQPDDIFAYYFERNRITDNKRKKQNVRYLPCTILFTKELYEKTGGFDEDFTGEYTGGYGFFDNDFSKRMPEYGFYRAIPPIIVTEYMEDYVGPNIQQKTGVKQKNLNINKHLWYDKMNGDKPRSRDHIRFNWEKDFERKR